MIKALIFDFDGLILDTESPEYFSLNEAYEEHGHQLPIATYGRVVGSEYSHEYEPVAHLEGLTGKTLDRNAFIQQVYQRRIELIEQNQVLPGVEKLILEGKARNLKLAVASSSPHQWVDGHLKRLNLFDCFDVIICKDDVLKIKPNPDLFLAALDRLGISADEAVIFEDSLNGILAARRAGIRVVAVPNHITKHTNIEGETLRISSLADFSLEELLNKL